MPVDLVLLTILWSIFSIRSYKYSNQFLCRSFGKAPLKQPNCLACPVLLGDHHLLQGSLELHTQGRRFLVQSVDDYHSGVLPGVYSGSAALLILQMLENPVKLHLQLLATSRSPRPHEASHTHARSQNQMRVRWHDCSAAACHSSWWISQKELVIDDCFVVIQLLLVNI